MQPDYMTQSRNYPPRSFHSFEQEYKQWVDYNFGETPDDAPEHLKQKQVEQFLGVVEEVGELSHALLKQTQGIRGTSDEHEAAQKDAVGDIAIFLAGFCHRKGWSLRDIVLETWKEVRLRDWVQYPKNGQNE